jgi:hypothetical protein
LSAAKPALVVAACTVAGSVATEDADGTGLVCGKLTDIASDAAFDQIAFRAGVITTWTRDMLQNATPDVAGTSRYDMSTQLACEIDYAVLCGTGAAPQPMGLINKPADPSIPGATASYALSTDLEASLAGLAVIRGIG